MSDWFQPDTIIELAEKYKTLGPAVGILLPFIEAFLPFLPLIVFVVANAGAYGLLYGFILSWCGTVAGSFTVFLIIRKYGRKRFLQFLTKHDKVSKLIRWVERNGFGPLFLLICFPFTPSALVNLVAGLSNMKKTNYLFILLLGKFVMIFTMSYIGHDLRALFTQPTRTAVVISLIIVLWLVGKWFEKRLDKKVEEDFRSIAAERKKREG